MRKIIILLSLVLNVSFAQLSFDRTRVVFDHGKTASQSVVMTNNSKTQPYLAQTWIEDSNGVKITEPLIALPILQRINPNQDKQVKVSLVGQVNNLPQDRESLFYFNALGVPPKASGGGNVVAIVMQSKLKLFYRPKGLAEYPTSNGWLEEIVIRKNGNGLVIQNPSAYHAVLYGITSSGNKKIIEKELIIKPFSSEDYNVRVVGNTLNLFYVSDFGDAKKVTYQCSGDNCRIQGVK